jgi:hypothetical protein
MGFFGPSKADLQKQIDKLETELEYTKNDYDELTNRLNNAFGKIERLESRVDGIVETLNRALGPNFGDDLDAVPDHEGDGTVEVVDETYVAYKATENAIVELYIPAGAKVVYPDGIHENKLRTDMAVVNAFYNPDDVREHVRYRNKPRRGTKFGRGITLNDYEPDGPTELEQCDSHVIEDNSTWSADFTYHVGKIVTPEEDLNTDVNQSCESGIHFFRTIDSALDWY